jgi:zinc transport system substrate-binding protein
MKRWIFIGGICIALLGSASTYAAAPRVVVSILPVHSLVAGVMEGIGAPELLVRGGASPHATSLRPSDARTLAHAELVIWVGEGLETFLIKPIRGLAKNAQVIELINAPGVIVAKGGGEHDHGDPHIWLSTTNARAIIKAAVNALIKIDSENTARYRANAKKLQTRLSRLHTDIEQKLVPVRNAPYVVFHDAYDAFEREFGLRSVGAVTINPDRKPGARKLARLRRDIARHNAHCVFAEPQFRPALIKTLIAGTNARMGILDPMGAALKPGPNAYFKLMRKMAAALSKCLSNSTSP